MVRVRCGRPQIGNAPSVTGAGRFLWRSVNQQHHHGKDAAAERLCSTLSATRPKCPIRESPQCRERVDGASNPAAALSRWVRGDTARVIGHGGVTPCHAGILGWPCWRTFGHLCLIAARPFKNDSCGGGISSFLTPPSCPDSNLSRTIWAKQQYLRQALSMCYSESVDL